MDLNLKKEAADYAPSTLFLLSLLAGSGGYGGMRLVNDLHRQISPLSPPNNSIQLDLPDPRHKHKYEAISPMDTTTNPSSPSVVEGTGIPAINKLGEAPLTDAAGQTYDPSTGNTFAGATAVLAGVPLGFLGTKFLYDKYQEHELNKQVMQAKKQYSDQLLATQAATQAPIDKISEETPNVDKLCEELASELEKSAGFSISPEVAAKSKSIWNSIKASPLKRLGIGAGAAQFVPGVASTEYHAPRDISNFIHNRNPYVNNPPQLDIGGVKGDVINQLKFTPAEMGAINDTVDSNSVQGMKDVVNKYSNNSLKAGVDLWKDVAIGSGAGLLGLLIANHTSRKEREAKGQYPTQLQYAE